MSDDWETDPDFVVILLDIIAKIFRMMFPKENRDGDPKQLVVRVIRNPLIFHFTLILFTPSNSSAISLRALREEVKQSDRINKLKTAPKPSYGYGGKFGVERDRMDKSAVGHDHIEHVPKHSSQTDYSAGFGGKYGVQTDRQDQVGELFFFFAVRLSVLCSLGWDHKEHVEAHASQKDYSAGFGGKFGVQKDRQDKCAVGWDHKEQVAPHPSQKDYAFGFGGKYGVQADRMDSSSATWDEKGSTELHPSQMRPTIPTPSGGLSALRDRFETKGNKTNPTSNGPSPAQQRILEERARWEAERKQTSEKQQHQEQTQPVKDETNTTQTGPNILVGTESSSPVCASYCLRCWKNSIHMYFYVMHKGFTGKTNSGSRPIPPTTPTEPAMEPNPPPTVAAESVPEARSTEEAAPVPACEAHAIYYTAKAMYDYTAEEDDELTFSVGELITEIEKIDPGWWKGLCRGKIGLFPANYVEEQ
ncbi:unnamed protein product [Echinostoma caproni]|uniref:SH3 domain-containing protein n=1 Tax=Echinostoma caproni TaxID=27848 RepID=A0A183A9D4_9TREM|nr:unnamed protein product [Echinostoma caproni]